MNLIKKDPIKTYTHFQYRINSSIDIFIHFLFTNQNMWKLIHEENQDGLWLRSWDQNLTTPFKYKLQTQTIDYRSQPY